MGRGEAEDKPVFFLNIPQSPDSCLALPCQHLKCKVLWALINATNHPAGEQPWPRGWGSGLAPTAALPEPRIFTANCAALPLQGWEKGCKGNLHTISDGVERWLRG